MGRLGIFIDGGYLTSLMRDRFNNASLEYGRLIEEIAQGREILRTYYYDCLPHQSTPATPEESERYARHRRFHKALNHLPRFEVRLGKLARRTKFGGGYEYVQKRVDVLLAVDLARHAAKGAIQYAALVAGDSDLVPAVEIAKQEGVLVTLYHGPRGAPPMSTVSDELYDLCDERVQIGEELVERCRRQSAR